MGCLVILWHAVAEDAVNSVINEELWCRVPVASVKESNLVNTRLWLSIDNKGRRREEVHPMKEIERR